MAGATPLEDWSPNSSAEGKDKLETGKGTS